MDGGETRGTRWGDCGVYKEGKEAVVVLDFSFTNPHQLPPHYNLLHTVTMTAAPEVPNPSCRARVLSVADRPPSRTSASCSTQSRTSPSKTVPSPSSPPRTTLSSASKSPESAVPM